jgi:Txe/YoeB family toxin of Txe-Axe toxin-antitoxin module
MTNFGTMTMMYRDEYTRQARKDAKIARQNGFKDKVEDIIKVIRRDPFEDTPGHH